MHSECGFYSRGSVGPLEGPQQWVLIKEEARECENPGERPLAQPRGSHVCVCVCDAHTYKHVHADCWLLRSDLQPEPLLLPFSSAGCG